MATAPSCQSDDLNGITTREEGGVNEDGAVALQENTEGPSCGEPVHINTQGGRSIEKVKRFKICEVIISIVDTNMNNHQVSVNLTLNFLKFC